VHIKSSVTDDQAIDDLESEAETLVRVRAAEASELEPEISVVPRLYESGSISDQLVALSGAASLLVLGVPSARPRADHGVLGPVEDRVVVHAHCPVVTVNGPGPIVGQDHDKIVLGWTEGTTGRRALEAAAEEAALRGSLLSIVTIPPAATASPAHPSERINVEEALFDSIRRIESTYPGLRIDVTHRSGQVGTALEQSLDKAALLVLGSHHSEHHSRRTDRRRVDATFALPGDAGRPQWPSAGVQLREREPPFVPARCIKAARPTVVSRVSLCPVRAPPIACRHMNCPCFTRELRS
jgi:nucleotide-binding universal stress UspA family protein